MDLTRLQKAVSEEVTVQAGAVQLIQSIAAELKNSAGDQAAVNTMADQLSAAASALGDAITANTTPQAPPPPTP